MVGNDLLVRTLKLKLVRIRVNDELIRFCINFKSIKNKTKAKAVIKKHDVDFEFHCKLPNCGDACIFKHIPCDNVGIESIYFLA